MEKFSRSHPINGNIANEVYKIEEAQEMWIEEAKVGRTPTFFINGYELPPLYELSDLGPLIIELAGEYFIESDKLKVII